MAVTSTGDSGDNLLVVDSGTPTTASVTGGLGEDTIEVGFQFGNVTDATVFGGEGVSSPNDGDDSIDVVALTALVYGNGGDDSIDVEVEDATTIYGGLADDTIQVFSADGASILVYGGEDQDSISVDAEDGDVTVYGGTGVSDSLDGDDTIEIGFDGGAPDTALVYGNGGSDSIDVEVVDAATVYGGRGDDTIDVFNDSDASIQVFGGENDDSISIDAEDGDVTVYGGTGISDPLDGADTIEVGSFDFNGGDTIATSGPDTALVYGNGGDDLIDVGVNETASVYGGAGDDTITVVTTGETTATLEVFGGHDEDSIAVSAGAVADGELNGDVTVYGGEGITDPTDGDDTIDVGVSFFGGINDALFENAVVYGNGGDDLIDVAVTESALVYGGGDDDTINVDQVDADGALDVGDVSVFGGAGEDLIDVETGSAEATVSGGETLDATQNTSSGEDLSITHTTANEVDEGGPVASSFLLVGSTGGDAFSFDGVDGDAVEIRLGGGTDTVSIAGDTDDVTFTVDDGELNEADLGGADGTFDEGTGTVTFTFDGVDVTLVGITEFNETMAPPL